VYRSEGFYGDVVIIDIAVCDFTKYGCDLVYRVGNKETGTEIATAKTGIVFMNYAERAVAPVPEKFKSLFEQNEYSIEIQPGTTSNGK
jgi:acyl-CoA thioesterase FadM